MAQDANFPNIGRNNNIQVVIGLPAVGIGGSDNVNPGFVEEMPGPSSRSDVKEAPVQMSRRLRRIRSHERGLYLVSLSLVLFKSSYFSLVLVSCYGLVL